MKQWIYKILLVLFCGTCAFFCLFRITPYEATHQTYIGILATLMGVAATFVVGFQIFNSISHKEEIKELKGTIQFIRDEYEKLKKGQSEAQKELQYLFANIREYKAILDAEQIDNSNSLKSLDAFIHCHKALIYSLNYNSSETRNIFERLYKYLDKITLQNIGMLFEERNGEVYILDTNSSFYKSSLPEALNVILKDFMVDNKIITTHENFSRISILYEDLVQKFYDKLNEVYKVDNN